MANRKFHFSLIINFFFFISLLSPTLCLQGWSFDFCVANFINIPQIPPILKTTADFSHRSRDRPLFSSRNDAFVRTSDDILKKHEQIYLIYIGSDDYISYANNNLNSSDGLKQAFVNQVIATSVAEIKEEIRIAELSTVGLFTDYEQSECEHKGVDAEN